MHRTHTKVTSNVYLCPSRGLSVRERDGREKKRGKDFPDKQETMAWMSFEADILLSDIFVMTIINGRNKKAKEADNIF